MVVRFRLDSAKVVKSASMREPAQRLTQSPVAVSLAVWSAYRLWLMNEPGLEHRGSMSNRHRREATVARCKQRAPLQRRYR